MPLNHSLLSLTAITLFSMIAVCRPATAASQKITVGIMSGEDEDVWKVVAANAKKAGLELKLVTFTDYSTPNPALAEHDLDANAFQTESYLEAQNNQRHFKIHRAIDTYYQPLAIYSTRHHDLKNIKSHVLVGVPNDPSNEERAFKLLEHLGLIKLKPNHDVYPTVLDIAENPYHLDIKELDTPVISYSIMDVDYGVINTNWAIKSGLDVKKTRVALEDKSLTKPYVNFIAVNEEDLSKPWVKTLEKSFHQANVNKAIDQYYFGTTIPAWKAK